MMPFLDPVTLQPTNETRDADDQHARTHLRHHAARRRAVSGRDDDLGREARGREGAGASGRRRHRGGLPRRLARRSRGRPRDRRRGRHAAGSGRALHEPPIICALARAAKKDIEHAWEGVRTASRPRIHTFLATSDLHMKHKLRMTRAEVLARVAEMVAYARVVLRRRRVQPRGRGPQRSGVPPRGARRRDPRRRHHAQHPRHRRLHDARRVRRADRRRSARTCPASTDVIISVHCHDDLGLATANSLAGILAGARQAEVTVNGIGERAGNSSLEEVVMALHTRAPKFGLTTADRHDAAHEREPPREHRDGHGRAAEQGDRRRERLRARVGHPPGRHAQAPGDLRDHAARDGRRDARRASCSASTRGARRSPRASRSSACPSRARRSTASSRASRRSPIAAST